jgi:hypothetical protein
MKKAQLAKIAVSTEADKFLDQTLEKVNHENSGGRVTKADLASWLVLAMQAEMNTQTIEKIRKAYFNQAVYLENLLRTLKKNGRDSLNAEELARLHQSKNLGTKKKTTAQTQDEKTLEK